MIEKYNQNYTLTIEGSTRIVQFYLGERKEISANSLSPFRKVIKSEGELMKELIQYFSFLPVRTRFLQSVDGVISTSYGVTIDERYSSEVFSFSIELNGKKLEDEDFNELIEKMYSC